jgi:hypothetical protein
LWLTSQAQGNDMAMIGLLSIGVVLVMA